MPTLDRFRRNLGRPLVYGHRGASAHATENTIEAVERARRDGADGIEIDIRLARCGAVIVFHDDELSRLTRRVAKVIDTPLCELRQISLRGGGRISTFEEILEAAGTDTLINVEVKSPGPLRASRLIAATAKAIGCRSKTDQDRMIISSFDPTIVWRLARRLPTLALGLLFDPVWARSYRDGLLAPHLGAHAVHPKQTLVNSDAMVRWRRANLVINAWTIDEPERIRALAKLGVDGVITNDPGRARRALADERAS